MSRLTLELARECQAVPGLSATVSVSRQNEIFGAFAALGHGLFPVTTFETGLGAIRGFGRLLSFRRSLAARLAADGTHAVVTLMPHLWTPFVADVVHGAGARYVTVIHDAVGHPGDGSALLHGWLMRDVAKADRVVTLSRSVARHLVESGSAPPEKLRPAFLPDISYTGQPTPLGHDGASGPFRVLFFGRVLPYKGLPRLLEAVERLRAGGLDVRLGVYGEGDLRRLRPRLDAVGAEVVNRWIGEEEVTSVLRRFHAVALSHGEASQSGVAALALGAGVPVVALPVGGIAEQIQHGETGLLAAGTDAASLAEAIATLAGDAALHRRLCSRIAATRPERSTKRFLSELVSAACSPDPLPAGPPGVPGLDRGETDETSPSVVR